MILNLNSSSYEITNFLHSLLFLVFILFFTVRVTVFGQNDIIQQKDFEDFNSENFDETSVNITNKWFPLKPLTQLVYEGSTLEDGERVSHRVLFTVTDFTKVIDGVNTVVCWDQDYSEGILEESEIVFFAQDKEGNVWHFGQYPEELDEEGNLVEAPCWIHGIDDAVAGIIMKSSPTLGTPSYSEGWAPSVDWTDRGIVYQTDQKVQVPSGNYDNVLVIDETSRSEPDAHQLKYYARGVGNIQVGWMGEGELSQEELVLIEVRELVLGAIDETRASVLRLEKRAYENSNDVYGKTTPMVQRVSD